MTSSQMMLFGGGPPPVTYTALVAALYQSGKSMPPAGIAASGTSLYVTTQNNTDFTIPVVKLTSAGAITWQRVLSLSGATDVRGYGSDLIAENCAADSSGNVYVVGGFESAGVINGFLVKYNTSGTIQWQRKILAASNTSVNNLRVAIDSAGSNVYVIATWVKSSASASALLAYNSSGTLQWQRMLFTGGFNNVQSSAVAVDTSGNIFVGGSDQVAYPTASAFVVKYNSSGTLQWQQYIRGGSPNVNYMAFDSSGNIFCSGTPRTFKLNSSGTVQWGFTYSSGSVSAQGIAVDPTTGDFWGVYDDGNLTVTFNKFNTSGSNTATNNIGLASCFASIIAGGCFSDTGLYAFTKGIFSNANSVYTAGVWILPTTMVNTGPASRSLTYWTQSTYTAGTASTTTSAGLTSGANSITDAAGTFVDSAGAFTDSAGALSVTASTWT